MKKRTWALAAMMLLVAVASVSGQAFQTKRVLGLFEVKMTSTSANVTVTIDGQSAGTLPVTVYVKPGQHVFAFSAPGIPTKSAPVVISADTTIPYNPPPAQNAVLTVAVNVPNAAIQVDNQPIRGNQLELPIGNHTVAVSAPGYATAVQQVNLPSGPTTITVNLQAALVQLTVTVNVPGASLLIDNAPIVSPAMVATGPHTLQVTAPGYQPFAQQINVTPRGLTVPVTLVPATFPLTVRVNVPSAAILIDNTPVEKFPVALGVGDHVLSVTAPGFLPYTLPFSMSAQANQINVALVPALYALKVNVNVPTASVSVDNQPLQAGQGQLAPGNHTLMVAAPGFQIYSQTFVMPATATTLNVALIPELGTIVIKAENWVNPAGVRAIRVFVNDVEQKEKPLQLSLPAGTYNIRLEAGAASVQTTVSVIAGKSTTLTARSIIDIQ